MALRDIEKELVEYLEDLDVHLSIAPVNASLPFVVVNLISDDDPVTIGETVEDLRRDTFQIDYYASSYKDARVGGRALFTTMMQWEDAIVYADPGSKRMDSRDGTFRSSQDYIITYSDDPVSRAYVQNTVLDIAHGGTGQTTASNAINALLPSQTGNGGEYLTTDGTVASWANARPLPFTLSTPLIDEDDLPISELTTSNTVEVVGEALTVYPARS